MQIATEIASAGAGSPDVALDRLGPSAGAGFDVDVISSVDGLDALASEWIALERLSPAATVFQSFAHTRIWARRFAGEAHASALHVAVVRGAGRPILILPLAISRAHGLRIARIAGDPIAQYSDAILDPARASDAALEAALASLREARVDAVVLRRLRDDSALLRLAAPHLRPGIAVTVAPYADLAGLADFPAFLASLSRKMRQGLRNRRNHLEKAGAYAFETMHGGAEARAAVAEAVDLKRKWLVQRGNLSSAFVDPATRQCLLDLAESSESGAVVLRLVVDGEAAAIRFGFEHRGTHFAYMSAYDARFADVSPGKLLMEYCISGFKERGLERIDMLPPAGQHKRDWCRAEVGVADYTLPLSTAGRLYAEVYVERVRPALKRAFERMPPALRSLAAALFVTI